MSGATQKKQGPSDKYKRSEINATHDWPWPINSQWPGVWWPRWELHMLPVEWTFCGRHDDCAKSVFVSTKLPKIGDFDWYSDHALLSADISVDIAKYRELPDDWQEIHRQFQNWDVETKDNFKSLLSNSRYAERLENYCKTNFTSSVEAADALSSILQSAIREIFPNKKRRAKLSQYSKRINFSAEVQLAKRLFKKCQRDYMKDKYWSVPKFYSWKEKIQESSIFQ